MMRRAVVVCLAMSLAACSFGMQGAPPGHQQMTRIECSESIARPVADIVGGVLVTTILFFMAALASWGESTGGEGGASAILAAATVGSIVLFASSAATGFHRVSQCQAAKRALAVRVSVGETLAAAGAPPPATAVTGGQTVRPDSAARPPVGDSIAATRAPSAAAVVASGQSAADTGQRRAFTIEISGTRDTLAVGERLQLLASARSPSGDPLANLGYRWTSSNPAAATVGLAGRVSAVAPGLVTITAHIGAVTKSVTLLIVAR